jgi:hypothetical protein
VLYWIRRYVKFKQIAVKHRWRIIINCKNCNSQKLGMHRPGTLGKRYWVLCRTLRPRFRRTNKYRVKQPYALITGKVHHLAIEESTTCKIGARRILYRAAISLTSLLWYFTTKKGESGVFH